MENVYVKNNDKINLYNAGPKDIFEAFIQCLWRESMAWRMDEGSS